MKGICGVLIFCMTSLLYCDGIDFGALEKMKNTKTANTTGIHNFNTKKAKQLTSTLKTPKPGLESYLGKKMNKFVNEVAEYAGTHPASRSVEVAPTKKSSGNKNYICTFKCKDGLKLSGSVSVYESSNHRAQLKSEKMANTWCRKNGSPEGVLNQWGTGETDCVER